jgi:hypothetical protein
MAASEASVPAAVTGKAEGRRSPPATTTAQSKRDRRRQALMERLSTMNDKFQRERDMTYRDQLQKIQFDTSLVQRFDPYDPRALEVIGDLQTEHRQTQGPDVNHERARSLLDMAGIRFSDFIEDVEDLIEIRDFQLAQSKVCTKCKPSGEAVALIQRHRRTSTNERFKSIRIPTPTKSKLPSANTVR